jgi:hypothetical protein
MLRDHMIPKPPTVGPYACHMLLAGLTDGDMPLFCDMGSHLLVRSEKALTEDGVQVPDVALGEVRAFELRVSCGKKVKGQHRYFPLDDWQARHDWLRARAPGIGIEVLTVNCTASRVKIIKKARAFHIDQTDFTGILRVTDKEKFQLAVANGVGSTGKSFGHCLLVI